MPKYITIPDDDNGVIQLKPGLVDEAMDVAYALAMGVDYGRFDIDPIEAAILLDRVKAFAEEKSLLELVASCKSALKALRIHMDAYILVVDTMPEEVERG